MSTEEQYYEIGEWFFALDGCIYEYVGGDVGSKKICSMIDIKQSTFITASMKKNAHLIASAPKMYDLLNRLTNNDNCKKDIIHLLGEADNLLAKARGE